MTFCTIDTNCEAKLVTEDTSWALGALLLSLVAVIVAFRALDLEG